MSSSGPMALTVPGSPMSHRVQGAQCQESKSAKATKTNSASAAPRRGAGFRDDVLRTLSCRAHHRLQAAVWGRRP